MRPEELEQVTSTIDKHMGGINDSFELMVNNKIRKHSKENPNPHVHRCDEVKKHSKWVNVISVLVIVAIGGAVLALVIK